MTCYRGFLLGSCRRVAGGRAALRGAGADGRRHLGHGQPRELAGRGSRADGGFRPSRVVVVAKTTRYEFEQQRYRYAELSEEDLKQLVGPGRAVRYREWGWGQGCGRAPRAAGHLAEPDDGLPPVASGPPSRVGRGSPELGPEGCREATCAFSPASGRPEGEPWPGGCPPQKGGSPAPRLAAERVPKCRGHTPLSPGETEAWPGKALLERGRRSGGSGSLESARVSGAGKLTRGVLITV